MTNNHFRTLSLMLSCARNDRPLDVVRLARALELSCFDVDAILVELDRAGLVDADRARLTMAGLVVASSLPARRHTSVAA